METQISTQKSETISFTQLEQGFYEFVRLVGMVQLTCDSRHISSMSNLAKILIKLFLLTISAQIKLETR